MLKIGVRSGGGNLPLSLHNCRDALAKEAWNSKENITREISE
jgi:hypothetical protein